MVHWLRRLPILALVYRIGLMLVPFDASSPLLNASSDSRIRPTTD